MGKELELKEDEYNTIKFWATNKNTLYIDIDRIDPDAMYPDQYSFIEIPMSKIKDLKEFINSL